MNAQKNQLLKSETADFMDIMIPQEKIDLIARLGDENAMWVKIVDGGFLVNGEKVVPELRGVIVSVNPYLVRWTDKRPEKIPFNGQDTPEGYDLRCDLKINIDGTVVGLSLPKTSTKSQLGPYMKFLKNANLLPNRVVTRVRSKSVSSPHGKFNLAVFECLGGLDEIKRPEGEDPSVFENAAADPPAASQPASSNPWA